MCPRRPTRIRRNARAKYVPLLFWGLMDRQVRRRYRACLYTSRFEVGTPDFKMTCSPASVPGAAAALRSLWPYVAFQSSRRAINLCRCQASGRGAVISSRSRGQRVALVFFMRCCLSRCNPYSKHSCGATCVLCRRYSPSSLPLWPCPPAHLSRQQRGQDGPLSSRSSFLARRLL